MKIKIEIEIKIASFRQDCRKDQDCLLLGNLLKELIGTFFRRHSPSLTRIVPGIIFIFYEYSIRRESTREELKSSRDKKKCKARTAVGRGEEEPAM